jgi:hypothetical protein
MTDYREIMRLRSLGLNNSQIVCVLLAGKLHKPALARRPRALLAA